MKPEETRPPEAAVLLAGGAPYREVAAKVNVTLKTVYNWMQEPEFVAEVDRLSLMVGVASRAERLRICMRVIKQKVREESGEVITDKDILDWLKFAQSETDGAKLDLSKLDQLVQVENMTQIAGGNLAQMITKVNALALLSEHPADEQ